MDELQKFKTLAERSLRRVLSMEGRILKRTAYARCGRGLRPAEFDEIVQKLFADGFLTVSLSAHGKDRLELMDVVPSER